MARHTAKSHKIRKVEILVIQIYIETGMMKRSEEAERLIKEKGYLQVNLITDRKKG